MSENEDLVFYGRPSLRTAYLYSLLVVVGLLVGRVATGLDPAFDTLWYALFGALVIGLAYVNLARLFTVYTISEKAVHAKTGMLTRKCATVLFRHLTNVSMHQSDLEKALGLATICIESAGTGDREVVFERLTLGEAREVQQLVRATLQRHIQPVIKVQEREDPQASNM